MNARAFKKDEGGMGVSSGVINMIWGLGFAFAQVIIFKNLSEKTYRWIVYCSIFLAMFLLMLMSIVFRWGDSGLIEFFLVNFPIQIAFTAIALSIIHRKFSLQYVLFGIMIQIVYMLSDTTARAFSRIFAAPASEIAYFCCIPLCAFAISWLFRSFASNVKRLPLQNRKLLYFCILNVTACLFVSAVCFVALQYYEIRSKPVFFISIFVFISLVSSSLVSLLLHNQYVVGKYSAMIKKEELEGMVKYARVIEDTYEKIRGLKHDYNNILLSVSEKSDGQIKDELRRVIEDNLANADQYDLIKNLTAIQNMPVKALLSSKLIHFMNHNASIRFEVAGKVQDFYMDDFSLVRVMGILLDNAFEEAMQTEAKWMMVGIAQKHDSVVFIVENSCRESTPTMDVMMKKGFTSKGDGRGTGLANFKEMLSSYPHCSYQMGKKEKDVFFVKLTLANE